MSQAASHACKQADGPFSEVGVPDPLVKIITIVTTHVLTRILPLVQRARCCMLSQDQIHVISWLSVVFHMSFGKLL